MAKKAENHNHSNCPKVCTPACKLYFEYERKVWGFFGFFSHLVIRSDEVRKTAHDALSSLTINPVEQKEYKPVTTEHYQKHHLQMMKEFVLVRLVDNYQKYLSDILFDIFLHKPELLRSDAEVKVSTVLENESMEAFIRSYAEKKVESLTRKSFADIYDFFQKQFGIRLIDEKDLIKLAIAIRNIAVHNRCIINTRFISQTGENPSNKGKTKEFENDLLRELMDALPKSVTSIDNQVRRKLKMKGKRFSEALNKKPI